MVNGKIKDKADMYSFGCNTMIDISVYPFARYEKTA